MGKIISKRGKPAEPASPTGPEEFSIVEILIIDAGLDFVPSPEELEQIRRVFESIRKQLDSIIELSELLPQNIIKSSN